jgi:hypothetical protein
MVGMSPDNLVTLKDDMVAFIEGHGMRHFPALIPEEIPRVWWNEAETATGLSESWKDFVEMAKIAGAVMVCIGEDILDKTTLELLLHELHALSEAQEFSPEMEKANSLFLEVGKVGHIELAFAHQGVLFVHESVTEWYRRYRELVETVDHLQDLFDDDFEDDELDEDLP